MLCVYLCTLYTQSLFGLPTDCSVYMFAHNMFFMSKNIPHHHPMSHSLIMKRNYN